MGEAVFFRNLTTKGLTAVNSGERYFEGYLTVQVKDKQGEVTIVDELMKVLPVWIDRGAPISDTHSNRIIGKGINYSKVEYKDKDGEIYPAIQITGKIHKNYELDNDIWQKIKSGEYKGLSFGGATKSDREPMRMKDGSIAYSLKDLEHYEVAVCRDPAVPLALITEFNTLAKAVVDGEDLGGGRMLIKCDKYGCYVDKDNKEAGLKAPEARNEALVYDDKTHDQPSETPLENQAKIKKGEDESKLLSWDESDEDGRKFWFNPDKTRKQIDEEPESDNYGLPTDHNRETCPHCDRRGNPKKGTIGGKKVKKGDPWKGEQMEEGSYNPKRGRKETQEEKTRATQMEEERAVRDGKVRPPTPKHLVNPKDKGIAIVSDPKGKPYCPSCGRDHVAEDAKTLAGKPEDQTRMVSGTGGGKSPSCPGCGYRPEKKKGEDEIDDDEKSYNEQMALFERTFGKKHPMTLEDYREANRMHTGSTKVEKGEDWSNADGDKHGMYNQDTDEGGMGKKHTGPKNKRDSVLQGYGGEQNNTGEVGWSGSGSPYPKKKGYSDDFKEGGYEQQSADNPKKKRKKKAVAVNILSRLKSLDFLLRGKEPFLSNSWEAVRLDEKEREETKKKKKKPKEAEAVYEYQAGEKDPDKKFSGKLEDEKKNHLVTKPIPDSKGGRGSFQHCIDSNQDKHNPGGWCKQIERKVEKRHKKRGRTGHPTLEERSDPSYHGEPEEARQDKKRYVRWYEGLQDNTSSTGAERRAREDKVRQRQGYHGTGSDQTEYHREYKERRHPKTGKILAIGRKKDPEPHKTMVHPETLEIMDVDAPSEKESHTGKYHKMPKPEKRPTKPLFDKRGNPVDPTHEEQDKDLEDLGFKESKDKAVMTNILSRLKSLDFMLKRNEDEDELEEPSKEHKTHNTPNPPIKHIVWDEKLDRLTGIYNPYEWERKEVTSPDERLGSKDDEGKILESQGKKVKRKLEGKKRKKKGGFTLNYDDWNEGKDAKKKKKKLKKFTHEGEDEEVKLSALEKLKRIKDRLQAHKKKDGEFGGMNTGEVEWTEPRDTANSRTKRDNDVA